MLMLIVFDVPYIVLQRNFNTSHVNVNRLMYSFTTIGASISIHLMLMLIVTKSTCHRQTTLFQYISC